MARGQPTAAGHAAARGGGDRRGRRGRRDRAGRPRQAGRQDGSGRAAARPAHGRGCIVITLRRAMVAGLEIDTPSFVPHYPGHLPGSVESGLTVHLRPFSMEHLDELIAIEQPEDPLVFRALAVADEEDQVTIGELYAKIREAIVKLGDGAFDSSGRNQVPPALMYGSVVVTDVATATAAIDTIVLQGEGTTTSPLAAAGGEMAHYYRFEEIKHGHLLVALPDPKTPDQAYSYTGAAVPFDGTGVYPVPSDPHAHGFPTGYLPGSPEAQMNDRFNSTYPGLLGTIHALVNGDATTERFNAALGIMMSLKSQAMGMAAGLARPGLHVGPTFQYQPTCP